MQHNVKRRLVLLPVLALLVLVAGTTASAANLGFSLKIGGGVGYLLNGAGDLEKARQGHEAWASSGDMYYDDGGFWWVTNRTFWDSNYTYAFDWNKLSILPDFRLEGILKIGDSFGIGLGTAYLGFKSAGGYDLMLDASESPWWGSYTLTEDWTYDHTYKMTAIPISLNFYYFLPMGGMSMYVFGGPSVYFGSLNHELLYSHVETYDDSSWYYWNQSSDYAYDETVTEEATCTAFGFQGGVGLEIPLSPMFSLGIEAYGRFANFSNWNGTYAWSGHGNESFWIESYGTVYSSTWTSSGSESGYLYYYEWNTDTSRWAGAMEIWQNQPSGSWVRNVKKAAINLNSIGILIQAIINF